MGTHQVFLKHIDFYWGKEFSRNFYGSSVTAPPGSPFMLPPCTYAYAGREVGLR
jgi:hypothetical protein